MRHIFTEAAPSSEQLLAGKRARYLERKRSSRDSRCMHTPALNLCSAARRLGWLIWPCIETAPNPRFLSMRVSFLQLSHVRTNTIDVEPESSLRAYTRNVSLYFCGQNTYCCRRVFTVVNFVATDTCTTGLRQQTSLLRQLLC